VNSQLQSPDFHSSSCPNRNRGMALGIVTFCALETALSWKAIGQEGPAHFDLLWNLAAIAIVAQFFASFKCVRERLVLNLIIIRFAIGSIARMSPSLLVFTGDLQKPIYFTIWTFALAVSLSMLYSSLRFHPLVDSGE
jgi:hypothetical protein